eukprot:798103-Amphidinium_carterae.2
MMRVFTALVCDDLNSFAYDASVAGLNFSVEFSETMNLSVAGFSDRLEELLLAILQRVVTLHREAEEIAETPSAIAAESRQEHAKRKLLCGKKTAATPCRRAFEAA